jgi:2,5-diamino-6-(ribosylamino)-4(3H)-pyrimidinone 5'-phosphate reductase
MSNSTLATSPPEFLRGCLAISDNRPHVTLTWAQSLDSKIAGPGGKRVMISGDESMLMTHWYAHSILTRVGANDRMRSMHDAILVGINTLTNDDPRLQSTSNHRYYLWFTILIIQ